MLVVTHFQPRAWRSSSSRKPCFSGKRWPLSLWNMTLESALIGQFHIGEHRRTLASLQTSEVPALPPVFCMLKPTQVFFLFFAVMTRVIHVLSSLSCVHGKRPRHAPSILQGWHRSGGLTVREKKKKSSWAALESVQRNYATGDGGAFCPCVDMEGCYLAESPRWDFIKTWLWLKK